MIRIPQAPAELRDRNGTYTAETYSDGRAVRVYGRRGGFAYLAFEEDLGLVTKVPEGWVSPTTPAERQEIRGECPGTGRSASVCLDQSHATCELPAEPGPNPNRCPRCHAPAFAYCLGWCPVGRTADERLRALHVHVETEGADCDGTQRGGYLDGIREDEDELTFLERHVGFAVSVYARAGTLRVREERQRDYDGVLVDLDLEGVEPVRVFEWREATEEGYSARTVRTCYEIGCDR